MKQCFFAENDAALALSLEHARLYTAQPRRTTCKLCAGALPAEPDFVKQAIPYASCPRCGQLNGLHEDTLEFCQAIYGTEEYDRYYTAADEDAYRYRVDAIYRPKAAFLKDALLEEGLDPASLAFADVGCGAGHFVAALQAEGLHGASGYELSAGQVAYASRMVPGAAFRHLDFDETVAAAAAFPADVVSLIGVLEHVREPRRLLDALRANPRVRYLFTVTPLFSLCVFLEMAFPQAYPRHLVSDHTHLFTPRSLEWMEGEWGLQRRSEWWFGSDLIDLYRHVAVALDKQEGTRGMAAAWAALVQPLIDPLQLQLDERRLSSEVHLVLRIAR